MLRRRRGPSLLGVAATSAVVSRAAGAAQAKQQAAAQQAAAPAAATAQQAAAPAAPTAAPATAGPAAADPTIAQLQQLAALHAQGILTAEEFAAAKAKVLGI